MFSIVAQKLRDNDKGWFKKFTDNRENIEKMLIEHKGIITLLVSAMGGRQRVRGSISVIELIFEKAASNDLQISPNDFAVVTGLESCLYTIQSKLGVDFSEDTKNSASLRQAFAQALRCPICNGYLDPAKSVSYDHIKREEDGGDGGEENCQLTHPYCNSSAKN